MTHPDCLLCKSPSRHVEGPLADGAWFCNVCGLTFKVDAEGRLVRVSDTNHRSSPYRQAVKINGTDYRGRIP
jgi:transposase-like protein